MTDLPKQDSVKEIVNWCGYQGHAIQLAMFDSGLTKMCFFVLYSKTVSLPPENSNFELLVD